jgi:hypothetical protein
VACSCFSAAWPVSLHSCPLPPHRRRKRTSRCLRQSYLRRKERRASVAAKRPKLLPNNSILSYRLQTTLTHGSHVCLLDCQEFTSIRLSMALRFSAANKANPLVEIIIAAATDAAVPGKQRTSQRPLSDCSRRPDQSRLCALTSLDLARRSALQAPCSPGGHSAA